MILARELFAGMNRNGNARRIWEEIFVRNTLPNPDLPDTEITYHLDDANAAPFRFDAELPRLDITTKEFHRLKKKAGKK